MMDDVMRIAFARQGYIVVPDVLNQQQLDELNQVYDQHVLERDLCVGNDSPHICLSCGCKFMVDSRKPISPCPGVSTIVSFPTLNIPW